MDHRPTARPGPKREQTPRLVITLTRTRVLVALWLSLFVLGIVVAWLHPVVIYHERLDHDFSGRLYTVCTGPTIDGVCQRAQEVRDPIDMVIRSLFAATIVLAAVLGIEWLARNLRFRRG